MCIDMPEIRKTHQLGTTYPSLYLWDTKKERNKADPFGRENKKYLPLRLKIATKSNAMK